MKDNNLEDIFKDMANNFEQIAKGMESQMGRIKDKMTKEDAELIADTIKNIKLHETFDNLNVAVKNLNKTAKKI